MKLIDADVALETLIEKGQASRRYKLGEIWELNGQEIREALNTVPSAQPAQPEQQHERIFQEIVVEYLSYNTYPEYKGKPYFSIKYTENGQEFIGYGTYKPKVLSEYLKEYFMPSAQPEIVRCKDCKYNVSSHKCLHPESFFLVPDDDFYCGYAERRINGKTT